MKAKRAEDATMLVLKTEEAREHRQLLKTGKGKEANSPLEFPVGSQACYHLNFNSVKPTSDSDLQNCNIILRMDLW
jgi:hypothetical protein